MFKYKKLLFVLLFFTLYACNATNNKPLLISFSSDSTTIVLKNIELAGFLQLKNNINSDSVYQNVVSVLQTPSETDSLGTEKYFTGRLYVAGDSLVFVPNQPFVKGQNYLVQTMINTKFATAKDILTAKVGHKVKAQQQVLSR
jgi:hypothetical protein